MYLFVLMCKQIVLIAQKVPVRRHLNNFKEWGFIYSFLSRFAGKCDPQSRYLTQLHSDYKFAVKPATNHPSSSCWIHTFDNVAEKYSKWFWKCLCSHTVIRREQTFYQLGHTTCSTSDIWANKLAVKVNSSFLDSPI